MWIIFAWKLDRGSENKKGSLSADVTNMRDITSLSTLLKLRLVEESNSGESLAALNLSCSNSPYFSFKHELKTHTESNTGYMIEVFFSVFYIMTVRNSKWSLGPPTKNGYRRTLGR